MGSLLDDFILPGNANEALAKKGVQLMSIDDGVNRMMSGHDRGVAFRFFTLPVKNEIKSKLAKYAVFDEIEMIEWIKNKKQKPVEQVKKLPPELLAFDDEGNCVGGRYHAEYLRYKAGEATVGLQLDKWGDSGLTSGQIASLTAAGVYTVEQFAAIGAKTVQSRYTKDFVEAHDRALQYMGGKDLRARSSEQAEKLLEMEQLNTKLLARLEALENAKEDKKPSKKAVKEKEIEV